MIINIHKLWQELSIDAKHTMIYLAIGLCVLFIIMIVFSTVLLIYNTIREVYIFLIFKHFIFGYTYNIILYLTKGKISPK